MNTSASMERREFDDWSPASVFGRTGARADSVPRSSMPSKNALTVGRSNSYQHLTLSDNNDTARKASGGLTKSGTLRSPEEKDEEEDRDAREEHAVRVLQKYWRVSILYRREIESVKHVEQLREQLEIVSAQAIAHWLRRSRQRWAIVRYATQHRKRVQHEREAGTCLARWLYWQLCVARARHTLQHRVTARRHLGCWWRRVLLSRRLRRRRQLQVERDSHIRSNASRLIIQRFWRKVLRQRTKHEASQQIQRLLLRTALRWRAVKETQRRRRCREALGCMGRIMDRWCVRRAVVWWQEHTKKQRDVETVRQHQAACVLQRLVRVVLTAFRLVRRRDAATTIQSLTRARHAQRHYTRQRQERKWRAAIHIQRIARGFTTRRRFARLLQQLRERFKCQNCGLIEPGGLYCKFCGRRRTTFNVLVAGDAATSCTTASKLRRKTRKVPVSGETMSTPPPAPPVHSRTHRHTNGSVVVPSVLLMTMPEFARPSPRQGLIPVVASPRGLRQERSLVASPITQPRKPPSVRAASGRPSLHHRSLSVTPSTAVMAAATASVDKTRQRADALLQREFCDQSATMELHLQRLQKGGKAASR